MKHIKLFENFIEKKDKSLPAEAGVKDLHAIVDKIKKDSDLKKFTLSYTSPYPDNSDKNGLKHKAISGKWWAGIDVSIEDGSIFDGYIGQIKFVKNPGEDWKYYNVKLNKDWRNSEEEKLLLKYFQNKLSENISETEMPNGEIEYKGKIYVEDLGEGGFGAEKIEVGDLVATENWDKDTFIGYFVEEIAHVKRSSLRFAEVYFKNAKGNPITELRVVGFGTGWFKLKEKK